jgi:hypothetical protein
MTSQQTRREATRFVSATRGRLDIATTPADHTAVADSITAFLNSLGAALLSDAQRHQLWRMRVRAMRRAENR